MQPLRPRVPSVGAGIAPRLLPCCAWACAGAEMAALAPLRGRLRGSLLHVALLPTCLHADALNVRFVSGFGERGLRRDGSGSPRGRARLAGGSEASDEADMDIRGAWKVVGMAPALGPNPEGERQGAAKVAAWFPPAGSPRAVPAVWTLPLEMYVRGYASSDSPRGAAEQTERGTTHTGFGAPRKASAAPLLLPTTLTLRWALDMPSLERLLGSPGDETAGGLVKFVAARLGLRMGSDLLLRSEREGTPHMAWRVVAQRLAPAPGGLGTLLAAEAELEQALCFLSSDIARLLGPPVELLGTGRLFTLHRAAPQYRRARVRVPAESARWLRANGGQHLMGLAESVRRRLEDRGMKCPEFGITSSRRPFMNVLCIDTLDTELTADAVVGAALECLGELHAQLSDAASTHEGRVGFDRFRGLPPSRPPTLESGDHPHLVMRQSAVGERQSHASVGAATQSGPVATEIHIRDRPRLREALQGVHAEAAVAALSGSALPGSDSAASGSHGPRSASPAWAGLDAVMRAACEMRTPAIDDEGADELTWHNPARGSERGPAEVAAAEEALRVLGTVAVGAEEGGSVRQLLAEAAPATRAALQALAPFYDGLGSRLDIEEALSCLAAGPLVPEASPLPGTPRGDETVSFVLPPAADEAGPASGRVDWQLQREAQGPLAVAAAVVMEIAFAARQGGQELSPRAAADLEAFLARQWRLTQDRCRPPPVHRLPGLAGVLASIAPTPPATAAPRSVDMPPALHLPALALLEALSLLLSSHPPLGTVSAMLHAAAPLLPRDDCARALRLLLSAGVDSTLRRKGFGNMDSLPGERDGAGDGSGAQVAQGPARLRSRLLGNAAARLFDEDRASADSSATRYLDGSGSPADAADALVARLADGRDGGGGAASALSLLGAVRDLAGVGIGPDNAAFGRLCRRAANEGAALLAGSAWDTLVMPEDALSADEAPSPSSRAFLERQLKQGRLPLGPFLDHVATPWLIAHACAPPAEDPSTRAPSQAESARAALLFVLSRVHKGSLGAEGQAGPLGRFMAAVAADVPGPHAPAAETLLKRAAQAVVFGNVLQGASPQDALDLLRGVLRAVSCCAHLPPGHPFAQLGTVPERHPLSQRVFEASRLLTLAAVHPGPEERVVGIGATAGDDAAVPGIASHGEDAGEGSQGLGAGRGGLSSAELAAAAVMVGRLSTAQGVGPALRTALTRDAGVLGGVLARRGPVRAAAGVLQVFSREGIHPGVQAVVAQEIGARTGLDAQDLIEVASARLGASGTDTARQAEGAWADRGLLPAFLREGQVPHGLLGGVWRTPGPGSLRYDQRGAAAVVDAEWAETAALVEQLGPEAAVERLMRLPAPAVPALVVQAEGQGGRGSSGLHHSERSGAATDSREREREAGAGAKGSGLLAHLVPSVDQPSHAADAGTGAGASWQRWRLGALRS